MRILYVITKSNWGGAQRHVFDLATAMKSRGHEVSVALGGDGILRARLEAAGIFTHSIAGLGRDISVSRDAGSFGEIFKVIRSKRPDILHLHSPKAAGLGALAGRLLRVPRIIVTVHGWSFNEGRPWPQRLTILFFSWLTAMLSHLTILISTFDYDQAVRFPGIAGKIALIPLGIQAPVFMSVDGAKDFIAKSIGMSAADFAKKTALATIAELHPNKGLPYLIEAMSSVAIDYPNAISIIISDGQEKAALHMLIREKKLDQNVFLTGYVENATQYLKAFAAFILPSVKEGLPYVLLEAGAASLPVIATTVGGIPEIVEDTRSGLLIQPRDPRELAHAISFIIEQPEERRKYGAALKERVMTRFSLEKMLESVAKAYEGMKKI